MRLVKDDEGGKAAAGERGRAPCRRADRLAQPQPAQHEAEDELRHEQRLHDRQLPPVQGRRLKDEAGEAGGPAEKPQGAAREVQNQTQARGLAPATARARDVLGGDVQRVREGRAECEDRAHRTAPLLRRYLESPATAGKRKEGFE